MHRQLFILIDVDLPDDEIKERINKAFNYGQNGCFEDDATGYVENLESTLNDIRFAMKQEDQSLRPEEWER